MIIYQHLRTFAFLIGVVCTSGCGSSRPCLSESPDSGAVQNNVSIRGDVSPYLSLIDAPESGIDSEALSKREIILTGPIRLVFVNGATITIIPRMAQSMQDEGNESRWRI